MIDKQQITQILIQFGLPTTSDGKNDYPTLRNKMQGTIVEIESKADNSMPVQDEDASLAISQSASNQNMRLNDEKDSEKQVVQNIEKFIQRVRMMAHAIVQGTTNSFNPDSDGYVLNE